MNLDGEKSVLLAHVASTLFMTGLIWFVQAVHYPLLAHVGADQFAGYEAAHVRCTTWVVGPPMLIEALTAVLLIWRRPVGVSAAVCCAGLVLLLAIWLSTALSQVPRHAALAAGFDPEDHRRLVQSNWIRTIAWSLRSVVVMVMLAQVIAGGSSRAS